MLPRLRAATAAALFATLPCASVPAWSQSRLNDHDVEALMSNLKDDSKDFRKAFAGSIGKSTIRKTSQEKEARGQVESFAKQTGFLHNHFKDKRKSDGEVQRVLSSAASIDSLLTRVELSPQVTSSWVKVHHELDELANAYGLNPLPPVHQ